MSEYVYKKVRVMTDADREKYRAAGRAAYIAAGRPPLLSDPGSGRTVHELCPYNGRTIEGIEFRKGWCEAQEEAYERQREDPIQVEYDRLLRGVRWHGA